MKMFKKFNSSAIGYGILLLVCLGVAGVAHGYNMFHFPYFENDEGTYLSQGWSIVTQNKLAPYTYWYDHAPAGWILVAIWSIISGGFDSFGPTVFSGRVLMLVIQILNTLLVFVICKKMSGKLGAGVIACMFFGLSPLGIYFHRRMLLDNLMIFWVMMAWNCLLMTPFKLRHAYASAIAFGIAVLTKENAVFFVPGMLYLLHLKAHSYHKRFAILKWLAVSGTIISVYFLYALLKNELLPPVNNEHVSLLATLAQQYARGSSQPFWDPRSDFYRNLVEWIRKDPVIMYGGMGVTGVSFLAAIVNKNIRVVALFLGFFWLFLMRGALVIDFYIVPLIALVAISLGVVIDYGLQVVSKGKAWLYAILIAVTALVIGSAYYNGSRVQYLRDETTPQLQAMAWVFDHVPTDASIAIDDFGYIDFKERGYEKAEWFWKIWYDPEIQEEIDNDWKQIDYLFLSHEMLRQIGFRLHQPDWLRFVLTNSEVVAMFRGDPNKTHVDINNYETTNGDWIAVLKIRNENRLMSSASWRFYKQKFMKSYGQIVDPQKDETTSEGQAYAMLRAVWENDAVAFAGIWQWTQNHLQFRDQDVLLSKVWKKVDGRYSVADHNSRSGADQDVALALLIAAERWHKPEYEQSAKRIIEDIWKKEVVKVGTDYYLIAGTDAVSGNLYLINPGDISPASYGIFATVDSEHQWNQLRADSYKFLDRLGTKDGNSTYLPSDWIAINRQTGKLQSASTFGVGKNSSNEYGYEAFRTLWRVALDAKWFDDPRAIVYLNKVSKFLETEWQGQHHVSAVYQLSGESMVEYASLSADAGMLAAFSVTHPELAKQVFEQRYVKTYSYEQGFWTPETNYYDQNWAWFATTLHTNGLYKP